METFKRTPSSTNYRDHEDCHTAGQRETTFIFPEHNEAEAVTICSCGGWFYTPSQDEIFDL